MLTPAEQAKKFGPPPGYKMEAVLADPDIKESAQIAFDGNGLMHVLELRGYMQDADGVRHAGTRSAASPWHEDRNNDGTYETHGVFIDNMIFPRNVMPIGINVGPQQKSPTPTNSTRTRTRTTTASRTRRNSSLRAWAGWPTSSTRKATSLGRWTIGLTAPTNHGAGSGGRQPARCVSRPASMGGAQWGVTQDNYGKPWFQSGASGMPGYFQFPVVYGNFGQSRPVRTQSEHHVGRSRAHRRHAGGHEFGTHAGRLARARDGLGLGGVYVFRGDRLPQDMVGDYFYGEVVARIVRRLHSGQDSRA